MPKSPLLLATAGGVPPHRVFSDGKATIDFLRSVFDAVVEMLTPGPGGNGVLEAVVRIGDALILVSDAAGVPSDMRANTLLYVHDADAAVERARRAGAEVIAPAMDGFWGDRWGMVRDPQGNLWQIATHVEDVSADEIQRRIASLPER